MKGYERWQIFKDSKCHGANRAGSRRHIVCGGATGTGRRCLRSSGRQGDRDRKVVLRSGGQHGDKDRELTGMYEVQLSGLSKDGNNVLNPETRLLRGELLGDAPSKYFAAGALPSSGVCAVQTRGLTPV